MYPNELFLGMGLYEIFLTIGILAVFFLADKMGIKSGFSISLQKILIVAFVVAIALGFCGAILFQAFYDFLKTGVFQITKTTGMTFYGGLIFGVLAFLLVWFLAGKRFCKEGEEKKKFPAIADIAACLIPLAHAFGRLGCFFAGCCHGRETNAWYGVNMLTEHGWKTVVPVQLFEAVFLFALSALLFFLFFKKYKNANGESVTKETAQKQVWLHAPMLAVYAIVYGIWRFCIEFARGDDRGASGISFLSPSQLTAIVLFVVGVAYIILVFIRLKRKNDIKNDE